MRTLAVFAQVAVAFAADVPLHSSPLFSASDDYDEINLNIRMLNNATTVHTVAAKVVKNLGPRANILAICVRPLFSI